MEEKKKRKVKKFKFNMNKEYSSISEICKIAGNSLWVCELDYCGEGEVEIEVISEDTSLDEVFENIRNNMSDWNVFNDVDNRTLKSIIKKNYILMKLWSDINYLKLVSDKSW